MKNVLTLREKSSLLTILTSFVPSILVVILGALKTKYIIMYLGSDLNGIYQLMIHLSSFVMFGDLGLTAIFKISYYKTLASNDYEKTTKIYNYSIIYFKKITILMFFVSVLISLLAVFFVDPGISKVQIILLQFLVCVPNIFSFYIGKEIALLCARQKEYVYSFIFNITYILRLIISILIIANTNGLFIFLSVDMVLTSICFLIIGRLSNVSNKKVLHETCDLDNTPIQYSKYLIPNKICSIIFNNVDIMVISSILTNTFTSVYTAYIYIANCLVMLEGYIINSLKNSLGNLYNSKDDYKKIVTNEVILISTFIFVVLCVPLTIGMKSFIVQIWINDSVYLVDEITYVMFCLYFVFYSLKILSELFEDSIGSYKQTYKINIFQAIANIVFSIVLCKMFGMMGTVLATIIILAPLELRKINKSLRLAKVEYNRKYLYFFIVLSILEILIGVYFINHLIIKGILYWLLLMIVVTVISIIINYLIYYIIFDDFRVLSSDLFRKIFKR